MGLVEIESESELSCFAVPGWLDVLFGGFPDALFRFGIGKLTRDLKEHGGRRGFLYARDRSIAKDAVDSRCHLPAGLRNLAALWSKIPGWNDQAERATADMFIDDGIVVEVELDRIVGIPADVVGGRILPPLIEGGVVMRSENLIGEPQTEARAAQSIGPDLRVFTVAAHLLIIPLRGQMSGHRRMTPGKGVLAVADHLEWLIPFCIARNITMKTHQECEEPFVEEHPVRGDWVSLNTIRGDAIGRPTGYVVVTPECRRDQESIGIRVVPAFGIMTQLRHPV